MLKILFTFLCLISVSSAFAETTKAVATSPILVDAKFKQIHIKATKPITIASDKQRGLEIPIQGSDNCMLMPDKFVKGQTYVLNVTEKAGVVERGTVPYLVLKTDKDKVNSLDANLAGNTLRTYKITFDKTEFVLKCAIRVGEEADKETKTKITEQQFTEAFRKAGLQVVFGEEHPSHPSAPSQPSAQPAQEAPTSN